jgi:alanine racemase
MDENEAIKVRNETNNEYQKELHRLKKLTVVLDANTRDALEPIIDNAAWMKVKLEQTRTILTPMDVMVIYNNGGGQSGITNNKGFEEYRKLFQTYSAAIDKILSKMPESEQRNELQEWRESH